jgi:hypothetical protein
LLIDARRPGVALPSVNAVQVVGQLIADFVLIKHSASAMFDWITCLTAMQEWRADLAARQKQRLDI